VFVVVPVTTSYDSVLNPEKASDLSYLTAAPKYRQSDKEAGGAGRDCKLAMHAGVSPQAA
jgi:hypothetical protein